MRFLRTTSTSRLVAVLSGLVIAAAAGTAIAIAAVGAGPVPRAKPLASAIHSALAAKAPSGVSATISFTNNLVSTSYLQGTDPLLTGATGRLWAVPGHVRLELQSSNGDAQLVFDQGTVWAYDPSSNTVYEGRLPAERRPSKRRHATGIPSVARIASELGRLAAHLGISRAIPTDVGGRPSYRVVVSPKPAAGMIGNLQLAWDAARGVPLDLAVYARGNSTPALELKATGISYGRVPRSVFQISPPAGAKIVQLSAPANASASHPGTVTKPTTFRPVAPAHAGGLSLTKTHRFAGGALLTYGTGLGAVIVLERSGGKAPALPSQPSGQDGPGLMLPSLKVNGVSAQELPTELGTVIEFSRAGVTYLVLGSVPSRIAAAVARGL